MEWGSRNEIPKLREVAGLGRHLGGGEGITGTRKGRILMGNNPQGDEGNLVEVGLSLSWSW